MTRNKLILTLTSGLLLLSGAAWTMRPGGDGLAKVAKGDVVREVVSPGVVEPVSEQVALGFELPGHIAEVRVEEGERVSEGQVLARLDDRMAKARVARAEAALAAARARRDAILHGARSEEIKAAQAEAEAAKAAAWEREQSRGRVERLYQASSVSRSELDTAKGAADATRATADAAAARLELLRQGSRAEVRQEAIAAVAAAEADLEESRTLRSQTELRAPRAGVILRRLAEPGEQVGINPPRVILTLADLDRLHLRVEVDENEVGRIKLGQRGYATADAFGTERYPGRVVRLMNELGRKTLRADDPRGRTDTRVLEAMFVPDDPAGLPLGLRMDVHIETVARHQVLTVPIAAIDRANGQPRVTVVENGTRAPREVDLGPENGLMVEITAGLKEGDVVAVR